MIISFTEVRDRLNHPIEGKIPFSIWCEFYKFQLNETQAALLSKEKDFSEVDIQDNSIDVFYAAIINQDIPTLNRIKDKNIERYREFISNQKYLAFCAASESGNIDLLEHLEESISPDKIPEMLEANNYYAFRLAASNGHLSILKYIESIAPDKILEMLKANDYYAYKLAARNGHLNILEHLLNIVTPTEKNAMIDSGFCYVALKKAVAGHATTLINTLLENSAVFAHAEAHQDNEYGTYPDTFMATKITELRHRKASFIHPLDNPNPQFDILDKNEAQLCFYFIRHLIRQTNPEAAANAINSIGFLLGIPAVRALAHTSVRGGPENELLRLALTLNNPGAATLLMALPKVSRIAEANNFYEDEIRGQLNLRELALNRESSMHPLTPGEEQRLSAVTAQYQPQMGNISDILTTLRDDIISRYDKSTTKVCIRLDDGSDRVFKWEEINSTSSIDALNLTPEENNRLEQALLLNKYHAAYRYLLKPNPWMHERASFVCINDERTMRWSSFESHENMIALFYLAANDKTIGTLDGYDQDARVEHYITELSLIGRAHNWDKYRKVQDEKGNIKSEQYDDNERDKPSCPTGVKRRLFQAVLGHPKLKFLTKDVLDLEIRDFIRNSYKIILDSKPGYVIPLQHSFKVYVTELDLNQFANQEFKLEEFDINAKEITDIINEKYAVQLKNDNNLFQYFNNILHLDKSESAPEYHILKLWDFLNVNNLLDEYINTNKTLVFNEPHKHPETSADSNDKRLPEKNRLTP